MQRRRLLRSLILGHCLATKTYIIPWKNLGVPDDWN